MTAPWPEVPLTQVADLVRGVSYPKTDSRDDAAPGYLPVLRATNIQNDRLVLESDLVYVAESNVSVQQRLRPGDIVVATSSGSKHLVGKSAVLHSQWNGSFGAFCAGIRPKPNIESRYLTYFLQSPRYWKEIGKKALGVNINNLRRGDLETLSLPLPPVESQREIVAEIEKQFSRLDEAVANLQRVKANLGRLNNAVLCSALDGSLARPHVSESADGHFQIERILVAHRKAWRAGAKYTVPILSPPGGLPSLPASWVWAPLGLLGKDPCNTVQTGPFGAQLHNTDFRAAGVPVIAVGNLTGTGFRRDNLYFVDGAKAAQLSRYDVWAGDLLFARSGATLGKVCVAPTDVADWRMTGHILRARLNTDLMLPEVALYALAALPPVRKQVFGNVRGVTRPGFNTSLLESIYLPVPPIAEQHRIVAEVDRRLSIVREVEAEVDANLRRAQALRQAVLRKAFAG